MNNTTTGSVTTGITEDFKSLETLDGRSAIFDWFMFKNTGDTSLEIASLESDDNTAADDIADGKLNTIAAGDERSFLAINSGKFFVRTVDDSGSNSFEFSGTVR